MKTRQEASKILNVSIPTLIRMEQKGVLTPIKYTDSRSKVYYKEEEIENLIKPKRPLLEPKMKFRWFITEAPCLTGSKTEKRTLQQCRIDAETGDEIWEDIPIVYE